MMSSNNVNENNNIDCNQLKEDLLKELNEATNISGNLKTKFIELLKDFTSQDPEKVVATSFLKYVDQTRSNLHLTRLIIEIEYISSQNTKLCSLLNDLQRHLDSRLEQSREKFASKFNETAENGSFNEQIKVVFDDLPLLTQERIMLHYNRLISHFSPKKEATTAANGAQPKNPNSKMVYNKFQHNLFVLKELFLMEKAKNVSDFHEKKGDYYFMDPNENEKEPKKEKELLKQALVEYKTACKLAWDDEKHIVLRLKMAKCWQKMNESENDDDKTKNKSEAIFYTLTAINCALMKIENMPKEDAVDLELLKKLKKRKDEAKELYKTLSGSDTNIESFLIAHKFLVERILQIYSDKTREFQKYDSGLNVIKDGINLTQLNDHEILDRIRDWVPNAEKYAHEQDLLANNRRDAVVSYLNRIGEIYLEKSKENRANLDIAMKWLISVLKFSQQFIDEIGKIFIKMYYFF